MFVLFVSALAFGCAGSAGSPSPEGKALLLSSEPNGVMDIVEFKSSLLTGTAVGDEVSLVGRVGGGQSETWDTDQAAFLVRDINLKVESHDHGGNHENCKFCQEEKEKELQSMALVRMVDANGEVIPQDARRLLGIKANHIIVAQGTGAIDNGTLVFDASKIYIRR